MPHICLALSDALWIKTGQKEVEPESKPSGDPEEEDEDDEESYYRYGSREELTGINPAMFVESTDSVEKLFEKVSLIFSLFLAFFRKMLIIFHFVCA